MLRNSALRGIYGHLQTLSPEPSLSTFFLEHSASSRFSYPRVYILARCVEMCVGWISGDETLKAKVKRMGELVTLVPRRTRLARVASLITTNT